MKALDIILLCAREYNDLGFARVGKDLASAPKENGANWLDWLNDAQRAIVLVRPDASATTENVTLVAGAKQTLPAGRQRLLGVTRNMGSSGTAPGRTIRFAEREIKDDVSRDWHTATPKAVIDEVLYSDKKNPLVFYVSPPAIAGQQIEVEVSRIPIVVPDASTADITLPDIYASPIQQWMLHRAFALNTQAVGQWQRSMGYFTAFFNLLGVKIRAEMLQAAATPGAFPQQPQVTAGAR